MLETPDTTEAFNQLRMIKTTPLGNLIAFMEVYNLRFGAATTPTQRQIYRQLYETLDQVRDRVVKESKVDLNATAAGRSEYRRRLLQQDGYRSNRGQRQEVNSWPRLVPPMPPSITTIETEIVTGWY